MSTNATTAATTATTSTTKLAYENDVATDTIVARITRFTSNLAFIKEKIVTKLEELRKSLLGDQEALTKLNEVIDALNELPLDVSGPQKPTPPKTQAAAKALISEITAKIADVDRELATLPRKEDKRDATQKNRASELTEARKKLVKDQTELQALAKSLPTQGGKTRKSSPFNMMKYVSKMMPQRKTQKKHRKH